jgi:hypothetical protein
MPILGAGEQEVKSKKENFPRKAGLHQGCDEYFRKSCCDQGNTRPKEKE